jgi:hypothetical protein
MSQRLEKPNSNAYQELKDFNSEALNSDVSVHSYRYDTDTFFLPEKEILRLYTTDKPKDRQWLRCRSPLCGATTVQMVT